MNYEKKLTNLVLLPVDESELSKIRSRVKTFKYKVNTNGTVVSDITLCEIMVSEDNIDSLEPILRELVHFFKNFKNTKAIRLIGYDDKESVEFEMSNITVVDFDIHFKTMSGDLVIQIVTMCPYDDFVKR